LNDARPAGGSGLLEVQVARKAFTSAAGERLDVLSDLRFVLRAGEVGALVGPSGCGKTTLLRIIAGLDRDYVGNIGRPPAGRIGMVFQEPRLLPWRSVDQNVRLIAPQATDAELADLFAVLGLTAHRGHFPGELSLGLARRVALARAFAVAPELLLLDEPFVSLDAPLAARLRRELALLVEGRSVTTLLVTHDLDEAIELADRVFLLSPRPARVLEEVPILTPRKSRTDDEIASIKSTMANTIKNGR
jgi:ABC-type nitrate/sulfonate/bicarbonate transport system ATPase subunit